MKPLCQHNCENVTVIQKYMNDLHTDNTNVIHSLNLIIYVADNINDFRIDRSC
jgi:HD superfamily phosphohydrolase YqeK